MAKLAAQFAPGIEKFREHFDIVRLSEILRIPYHESLLLPSDRAYYTLLAEAKKAQYIYHVERLRPKPKH